MGTKNQRAVCEWINISDDLVYEWVLFFKARYTNGVGFEILARTPVPQPKTGFSLPGTIYKVLAEKTNEPCHKKINLQGICEIKSLDQPANQNYLVWAFVIMIHSSNS